MILVDYIGASKQGSVYEGMEADPGENLIVGIEEGKLKLMYDALCLTGSSDIGGHRAVAIYVATRIVLPGFSAVYVMGGSIVDV